MLLWKFSILHHRLCHNVYFHWTGNSHFVFNNYIDVIIEFRASIWSWKIAVNLKIIKKVRNPQEGVGIPREPEDLVPRQLLDQCPQDNKTKIVKNLKKRRCTGWNAKQNKQNISHEGSPVLQGGIMMALVPIALDLDLDHTHSVMRGSIDPTTQITQLRLEQILKLLNMRMQDHNCLRMNRICSSSWWGWCIS